MNAKAFVVGTIVTAMGFIAGVLTNRAVSSHDLPGRPAEAISRIDTVIVRDTVTEYYPTPVAVKTVDTMLVAIRDTVVIHDTTYVALPRESRRYLGADYEVWVSGFRPSLDSVMVFPETRIVNKNTISVTPRKRWGVGLQAGYGVDLDGSAVRLSPYIGVGVSYDLFQW